MSSDPVATPTPPADEQWDDTLDALARAVTHDLQQKALLRDHAADAVRYHFRSYARRLLNPLLDQVQSELQASYRRVVELREENRRLQAHLTGVCRARNQLTSWLVALAAVCAVLALVTTALLWSARTSARLDSRAGTTVQTQDLLDAVNPSAASSTP